MFKLIEREGVGGDLQRLRAYDRSRFLDAIETQLAQAANTQARNKKFLENLVPPFEAVPPVWQLQIGDLRVFYDVDEDERTVFVRAVRRKPPHKTTEESL